MVDNESSNVHCEAVLVVLVVLAVLLEWNFLTKIDAKCSQDISRMMRESSIQQ